MTLLAMNKVKKYNQVKSGMCKDKSLTQRDQMVREYAPLVKTIAGRLATKLPHHISQDDLLSAGIMGLLDAIDKYDETKGTEFKSYAEYRIRGAMIDELRSMDWVPRSVRRNSKRLEDAYFKIEQIKLRPATDEEVAAELGISLGALHRLLDETRGISIINDYEIGQLVPAEEYDPIGPTNNLKISNNPLDSIKIAEVKDTIARAIDHLPQNERIVVALYYYEELTMKEIGEIMGYTESRVSQLHTKSVIRLRNSLKGYFDK
jgi:RNA polymerase sigma factor for flagellar operon FliA